MKRTAGVQESVGMLLRMLKLPSFGASYEQVARQAEDDGWTHIDYLRHLVEL